MSFVGKILVVVQVVLSICFMALAGAVSSVQNNWRAEAEKNKTALTKSQTELNDLQTEYKKFQDDSKLQITKAESDSEDNKAKFLNADSELKGLKEKFASLAETEKSQAEVASISAEEAQSRRVESLLLRELLRKALDAKDGEFKQKTLLEDKNFEAKLELEQIKKDYLEAQRKIRRLMDLLVANKIPLDARLPLAQAEPAPNVSGKVIGIGKGKQGTELVEISLGKDDGLDENARHELYVYRTGSSGDKPRYLGKIRIIYTDPDRAVGTIIQKAKNGIIQAGDYVSTKL